MVGSRAAVGILAILALGGATSACGLFFSDARAGASALTNPPKEANVSTTPADLAVNVKLDAPINLPKGIDPNTPLKDCLEFLSELQDLRIKIDKEAFRHAGIPDPEQAPVGLSRVNGVTTRFVLQRLLAGVDPATTYIVRDGHIVVTMRSRSSPTEWVVGNRHLVPRVDLQFDRRPLEQALRDVTTASGVNVVLDPRVGEKGKMAVTATLTQASVDTAVYLLADMADLKAVALDTALYVTTKENAEVMRAELEKREAKQRAGAGPGVP